MTVRKICKINLIENMDLSDSTKQRLLAGTAIEWLGLDKARYIG